MEAGKPQLERNGHAQASSASARAPSVITTLRRAIRAVWDHLGLLCGLSCTLFAVSAAGLSALSALARMLGLSRLWEVAAGAAWMAFVAVPLYAGIAQIAHRILAHRVAPSEPPTYADLWVAFRSLWLRAVFLGLVEFVVSAVLMGNLVFYLIRGGFGFLLLAAFFVYLTAFWLVNMMYHWPLLIAAEEGLIPTESLPAGRRKARVSAALRNSLLLAAGAPLRGFGVCAFLAATGLALAASGIGLVFLLPGYSAVLAAQATWDELVRMGVVEAPPDPEAPPTDPGMRL
ncbi:MAG: hypothetical protein ACP5VE_08155 [Chthonomonadales bacterium]